MEEQENAPEILSSDVQPTVPLPSNKPVLKPSLPLVILIIVFLISLITLAVFFLSKRLDFFNTRIAIPTNSSQGSPSPSVPQELDIQKDIQSREHLNDQKNISPGDIVSSGFIDPSLFTKKTSSSSVLELVKKAHAQEVKQVPALFYVKNKTQIAVLDLFSNQEYLLLDLKDFSSISVNSGTVISKQYFVNKSKQVVFQLMEKLVDDKYKTSFQVYDIRSQSLKEVVSTTGGSGDPANWNGFSISPDEHSLFILYVNPYESDPFADVANKVVENPGYFDNTYFFFNLDDGSLKKFKLDERLTGMINFQWSSDSNSVLLLYSRTYETPSSLVLFSVSPLAVKEILFQGSGSERDLVKGQYFPDLKKIFYISTGSNKEESTFSERHFGYLNLASQNFNDVIEPGYEVTQFVFDFNKGFVVNTQVHSESQTSSKALNYYDLSTGKVTKIIEGAFNILGFNGDYRHLLVSSLNGSRSDLYDLDIETGQTNYLTTTQAAIPYQF
ncbi:MAG TPA: hypothetical protein VMW04_03310 [Patescibacteria group bacterium]|nr:hypothetical protein [Patescibacteria group bacterium]